MEHDLWKDSDKDIPRSIVDRNGQVVLALCKRCHKGEAELEPGNCISHERFIVEYIERSSDGPVLTRIPLREWPEWANELNPGYVKQEPLCEDEGCPHSGTEHICISQPPGQCAQCLTYNGHQDGCPLAAPVVVAATADADEMNRIHGESYGVDWIYPPQAICPDCAKRIDDAAGVDVAAKNRHIKKLNEILDLAMTIVDDVEHNEFLTSEGIDRAQAVREMRDELRKGDPQ